MHKLYGSCDVIMILMTEVEQKQSKILNISHIASVLKFWCHCLLWWFLKPRIEKKCQKYTKPICISN